MVHYLSFMLLSRVVGKAPSLGRGSQLGRLHSPQLLAKAGHCPCREVVRKAAEETVEDMVAHSGLPAIMPALSKTLHSTKVLSAFSAS